MGSVAVLLSMTRNELSLARGLAVAALFNAGANLALIPRFGMAGAALATAVTMLLWNLALARAVKARLGVSAWAFGGRAAPRSPGDEGTKHT
jgi:O-antigen/teichoic acid export membrane protein